MRDATVCAARNADDVIAQVGSMRARWRAERDRSTPQLLDLKQGGGTLLDIEFLLQTLVLLHAQAHPHLAESGNSATLIARARQARLLDARQARALADAHALLLTRALSCTLDARPRLAPRDEELLADARAVLDVAAVLGLRFG